MTKKRGGRSTSRLAGRRLAALVMVFIAVAAVTTYVFYWRSPGENGEGSTSVVPYYWVFVEDDDLRRVLAKLLEEYSIEKSKPMPNPAITETLSAFSGIVPFFRLVKMEGSNISARYAPIYVDSGRVNIVESYLRRNNATPILVCRSAGNQPTVYDVVESLGNTSSNNGLWIAVRIQNRYGIWRVEDYLESAGVPFVETRYPAFTEIAVPLEYGGVLGKYIYKYNVTLAAYPGGLPPGIIPK